VRPTQHPSNNDVLRAPPSMGVEQCRPLAITRVKYSDGMPGVWSYWEPTDAERAAIAAGALVRVSALGLTHPPIHIGVDGIVGEGT
jgi:hypothetical protein